MPKLLALVGLAALAISDQALAQNTGSPGELIARMDQVDSNRDGIVTRAELIEWRKANFSRFDRNGDKVLSDADLPALLRGTALASNFDDMKRQFDANRDGRVTYDEFAGAPTLLFDTADADRDDRLTRAERNTAVATANAKGQ